MKTFKNDNKTKNNVKKMTITNIITATKSKTSQFKLKIKSKRLYYEL